MYVCMIIHTCICANAFSWCVIFLSVVIISSFCKHNASLFSVFHSLALSPHKMRMYLHIYIYVAHTFRVYLASFLCIQYKMPS